MYTNRVKYKTLILLTSIILSLIIFINQSISHIKYRSQSEDDMQLTTLLQKIYYPSDQNYQKLLTKQKLKFEFTAKHNNLGTIAYIFNNYQKIKVTDKSN